MDKIKREADFKLDITKEKLADIPKGMFGLFFEDINYAADGGLYAETIENGSFEALKYVGGGKTEFDGGYGWEPLDGSGKTTFEIKSDSPLNENNLHYLELNCAEAGGGVKNKAFDGIYLKKGETYTVSVWARSKGYDGGISASIVKDGQVVAGAELTKEVSDKWTKYRAEFSAERETRGAEFVLSFDGIGRADLDMVSCIPKDAVFGIFRRDLAEKLKALSPGFLRFPGGCIVEGYDLKNRYNWKDGVGAVEERKQNWNRWSAHTDTGADNGYKHYNQTYGMGFYEYFLLCEYLGARPLPVVNCGLGCQYQSKEVIDTNGKEFETYIKDALDLIEFANGDVSTYWGGLRAKMGHEEPFGLELIGIGNEQWQTETNDFYAKYEAFEKAIHGAYPDIKLVATAGPKVKDEAYDSAWSWIRERSETNPNFAAVVDEHYYMTPEWFFENDDFYDDYNRSVKVFAGEYASRNDGDNRPNYPQANTLLSAISEAAFMTGLERNADVVCMASYAPLFARVGYTQWSPDLIWFDDKTSYVTPSYYTQYMYANNTGDYVLKSEIEPKRGHKLYHTVSYKEETGEIIIKLVNGLEEAKTAKITAPAPLTGAAVITVLRGDYAAAYNSIAEPDRIRIEKLETKVCESGERSFEFTAPPLSFCVIRIAVR
ncbi:MAG TPA: carbohydrate binding domain-containing protein [Firmicutes bacterium]|nr:carbohydrate binding domain-containing protein [Bacillota bacterium]